MFNKQQSLKLILVGAAIGGFPGTAAWACSIPVSSELIVNAPSGVLMVDGKDRHSRVKIEVRLDAPERSVFDFGFANDGLYTPITDGLHSRGRYIFAGGAVVDFALRRSGADRLFGTPDDLVYRLSDGAGYARQTYFKPVKSSKSRNPAVTQVYFQDLRLSWDLDLDGKPDVRAVLESKRGKYDGMTPAPAAVPVPAAMWLFGSGLLGLAAMLRRAGKGQRKAFGNP